MSNRQLPRTVDVFAYWRDGQVSLVLHGPEASDDRATTLTTQQALRLAEGLVRAVREAAAS